MNEEDKTSNYSMSDFYEVLDWLPRSKVDRQEPCEVTSIIINGSSVVIPTIYEEFDGIDLVQIFINLGGVDVDVNDVLLDFSPLDNGNLSLLQAKCTDSEIDCDNDTIITFNLDNNIRFTDETRVITGIKSLKLNFGIDVTNAKITNVVFRCRDYTYTLTDIEKALYSGEAHVLRKLGKYARKRNIPQELMRFVYMAGGAYAWLTRWEYETKPMKEPKSESNNYADRLLGQVDSAIAEWVSDIENKKDHDDLFNATYKPLEWGI